MKLSKQVTSLEISKRLKELGVKQESLFYYFKDAVDIDEWMYSFGIRNEQKLRGIDHHFDNVSGMVDFFDDKQNVDDFYSAFTVAELVNMLREFDKTDILIPPEVINVADFLANKIIYEKSKN